MPTIRKLASQVADRIAAGEVVERPASIVKELLENSLDAEATQISIEVRKGGIESIDARDNGCGIARNQLALAIENHTTSKIAVAQDLNNIHSLGFRGEALASIAAVSHLRLTSRVHNTDQSWQIEGRSGARQDPKPAAMNYGTWVRVEELFHNVPARRKFLRSPATEFSHIDKVFCRIALSRPQVFFSLTHNDRLIHQVDAASDISEIRLRELSAENFAASSLPLDSGKGQYRVRGWIIKPSCASPHTNIQYFYINGRFVRDRILSHACKQGYGELLFSRNVPAYILFIDMPTTDVDVNVHPAKYEVRFRDGQLIHSLVCNSIRKRLARIDEPPKTFRSQSSPYRQVHHKEFDKYKISENAWQAEQYIHQNSSTEKQPAANESIFSLGTAVGLLDGIYIIAINDKGLVVVDAHAAHERILFEQLRSRWRHKEREIQQLLFPITVHLSSGDFAYLEENLSRFAEWGFELRVVGATTVSIQAIPALLTQDRLEEMLRSLCQILQDHQADGVTLTAAANDKIFSSMACYGAIRANRKMTTMEMDALLRRLEKTPRNYACNHGRPTWFQIEREHLDKELLHGQ